MKSAKNIYLVGMPGAGKSTLGKTLAHAMGRDFIDLDDVIEEQMDMSISQIFSELGESQFRIAEKRALEFVMMNDHQVIGTGGGTPCFFDNMDQMNKNGITVFLNPPVQTLIDRIKADFKERPKLAQSSSLIEILQRTFEERKSFYQKAHITLSDSNISAPDILDALESEA